MNSLFDLAQQQDPMTMQSRNSLLALTQQQPFDPGMQPDISQMPMNSLRNNATGATYNFQSQPTAGQDNPGNLPDYARPIEIQGQKGYWSKGDPTSTVVMQDGSLKRIQSEQDMIAERRRMKEDLAIAQARQNFEAGALDIQAKQKALRAPAVQTATGEERTAGGYALRMLEAERSLQEAAKNDASAAKPGFIEQAMGGTGMIANLSRSNDRQLYRQGQEDWVRAKLRKESGAVIGEDEMAREISTYFPQIGDSNDAISQKALARQTAMGAMNISAGRAAPSTDESLSNRGKSPAKIQSDAEYSKLPSGAEYIAPDGSVRRKK